MSPPDLDVLLAGVLEGDRLKLARALTLVESTRAADREAADYLMSRILQRSSGQTLRIGITGPPGVGKSTFIEALGTRLANSGHRIAVLAVDPTSRVSGGSILGDKTRMTGLASHPSAFVRPSPSGLRGGGVARSTREAILLCEAAGFDIIFVETVGAGQAETTAYGMVDCFVLLAMPDAGDELQGIKRGVVELADIIVVNRADGDRVHAADRMRATLLSARRRSAQDHPAEKQPSIHVASALTGEGLDRVWKSIQDFADEARAASRFESRRSEQRRTWLRELIRERLLDELTARTGDILSRYEEMVVREEMSASAAADAVLAAFRASVAASQEAEQLNPERSPRA